MGAQYRFPDLFPGEHRAVFTDPPGAVGGLDGAAHAGTVSAAHPRLETELAGSPGSLVDGTEHGLRAAGIKIGVVQIVHDIRDQAFRAGAAVFRGDEDLCAQGGYDCPAWRYAAARYALYRAGRPVELLACYDPAFRFMSEWWKQLYGESEGKDGKGLFPASVDFTADLHSMGQYIQQGQRLMLETVVRLGASEHQLCVPRDESDGDGLNFLAGESMDFIRDRAMEGTLLAHHEGGVPNLIVEADGKTPNALGQLIYFFEYACGLSGYLLDVNPFDQPGVEAYKKNMFALLGKPGYEERKAELEAKLNK